MSHARGKPRSASAAEDEAPLAGPVAYTLSEAGRAPLAAAAGRRAQARAAVGRPLYVPVACGSPPGPGRLPAAAPARARGETGP
jgi:hypothetical protein